jgi:hypothetical protein
MGAEHRKGFVVELVLGKSCRKWIKLGDMSLDYRNTREERNLEQ